MHSILYERIRVKKSTLVEFLERKVLHVQVICNQCAKVIKSENEIFKEDFFVGRKEWGYFSEKDREIDSFYLCEKCYDEMIKKFIVPVHRTERIEVL